MPDLYRVNHYVAEIQAKSLSKHRNLGSPQHTYHRNIMNRLLSVVRSRTDKIIELSRAALTVPRYGESNRLVGVD